jgi:hypothetical protein
VTELNIPDEAVAAAIDASAVDDESISDVLNAAAPLIVAAALEHAADFLDNEYDDAECRQFPRNSHSDGCGAAGLSCAAKHLRSQVNQLRGAR